MTKLELDLIKLKQSLSKILRDLQARSKKPRNLGPGSGKSFNAPKREKK